MDGYVGGEAGLVPVAVVVQLACMFSDDAVSPLTNPE